MSATRRLQSDTVTECAGSGGLCAVANKEHSSLLHLCTGSYHVPQTLLLLWDIEVSKSDKSKIEQQDFQPQHAGGGSEHLSVALACFNTPHAAAEHIHRQNPNAGAGTARNVRGAVAG